MAKVQEIETSRKNSNPTYKETNEEPKEKSSKPTLQMRKGKDLCPHRKFVHEHIDRNTMTHEEYAKFLAQPKWSTSPWYLYQKKQEDPEYQKKKLKKVYCILVDKGEWGSIKESKAQKNKTDRNKFFYLMNAIKYVPPSKGKRKKKYQANKSGTVTL